MNESIFVSILAYLFLAIAAIIPIWDGFKEFSKRKKFWIIFFAAGFIIFGVWDICNRSNDAENGNADIIGTIKKSSNDIKSNVKAATEPLFDTLRTLSSALQEKESPHTSDVSRKEQITYAYLRIKPATIANPLLEKSPTTHSIVLEFAVSNYGTGNARNIVTTDLFVDIKNGKIITQRNVPILISNKSYIIYADSKEYYGNSIPVNLNKNSNSDSTFWCLKIDFDDDTKIRKSFIKIFKADFRALTLAEANDSVFENIEKSLRQKKIWKHPFTQ